MEANDNKKPTLMGIPIFEVNRKGPEEAEIVFMSWEEWHRLKNDAAKEKDDE